MNSLMKTQPSQLQRPATSNGWELLNINGANDALGDGLTFTAYNMCPKME